MLNIVVLMGEVSKGRVALFVYALSEGQLIVVGNPYCSGISANACA